jgi:hypothetical protein
LDPFISSGYFGTTVNIACAGSLSGISVNFTADTNNFCTATSITGNTFAAGHPTGNYYLVESNQVIQISLTQFSNIVSVISVGCTTCPGASPTPTPTPTVTQTSTPTPTPTPTTTPAETPGLIFQLRNCDTGELFRFGGIMSALVEGTTYYITGSLDFDGCATVTSNTFQGPLYNSNNVTFTEIFDCSDSICPRTNRRASLLIRCYVGTVFYALVDEDTAFDGGTYIYEGNCYSWVEFSGPGGPYLGGPVSENCATCFPDPTPAVTPSVTPTNAITPVCPITTFCLDTNYTPLSGLTGTYNWYGGYYNCYPYYEGGNVEYGIIFWNSDSWCLSTSLGGTCLIRGAQPCFSICPDLDSNVFTAGACPPAPTPEVDCTVLDFEAYFDCGIPPTPTPVDCSPFGFTFSGMTVTPTPTTSPIFCSDVAIDFSLTSYSSPLNITPTPTPTVTPTNVISLSGSATFEILQSQVSCVTTKVLLDESTGTQYYTTDQLIYNGIVVVTGITMSVLLNGTDYLCLTYIGNNNNISSNSNVTQIFGIYGSYASCSTIPSPTPTSTQTPTPTITSSPTVTPTITSTPTITPTITRTPGLTPDPTPSFTPTNTPTNTLTPTNTPTNTLTPSVTQTNLPMVYVYESCQPLQLIPYLSTQIIQTQKVSGVETIGNSFKDSSGNCWKYNGAFIEGYTSPINFLGVNWNGNYFSTIGNVIYPNCSECLNPTSTNESQITINNFNTTTSQPDNCGGYEKNTTTLQVVNYNLDGVETPTSVEIQVTISLEVNDCLGTATETLIITIPAGSSSSTGNFVSYNLEDCPITNTCLPVTRTVNSVVSITPSTVTKSPLSQY